MKTILLAIAVILAVIGFTFVKMNGNHDKAVLICY